MDTACSWDHKAIQRALSQAQALEEEDSEAANQLRAQAQRARALLDGEQATTVQAYDAMRVKARVLRGYNGGVTWQDLKCMHYKEFFGLVRELSIMNDEEREAAKGAPSNQGNATIPHELPRPQKYAGEVIKLV